VTGFVHPKKVLTKRGMKLGDRLVLTKPLGTGVINTAIKGGLASTDVIDKVIRLMATLNRDAATVMARFPIHACTDVTGFGLLGHLAEMVVGTGYGVVLRTADIPILPEAIEYAGYGLLPAGAFKNREFRAALVAFSTGIDPLIPDLLFDPQTSGGLLICIGEENADRLLDGLVKKNATESKIIGEVVAEPKEKIVLK
jgi:selenide,water dikinase